MFKARYDKNSKKTINAKFINDENKIFYCLNSECSAEYKLRSHHGVKKQHFYRFPNAKDHIENCLYIDESNEAYHKDNVESFSIEDILNRIITKKSSTSQKTSGIKLGFSHSEKEIKTIINSPKTLLKFCVGNSIDTNINDTTTINIVYADHRNITDCNLGFTGLKMLYGTTFNYNKEDKTIHFIVRHKSLPIWLNARIYLPHTLYRECINFIYTNNNSKFSGFPIAVLAQWNKPKDYWVETNIISKSQVIYK